MKDLNQKEGSSDNSSGSGEELVNNWWRDPAQVELFETRLQAIKMSRRSVLGLLGGIAGSALLAACGGAATSTPPSLSAATTAPVMNTAAVGLATVGGGSTTTTAAAIAPTVTVAAGDLAATQLFTTAVAQDPTSMDFNKNLYCGGEASLFAGLLTFTPDYTVAPYAAETYEVKDGGSRYIFHLNPKGTWSNGEPVTADDFVYSFTRQLDPATAATYAGFLYDIKNAQSFNTKKGATAADLGLKALDKYSLEVTLEGPRGYFPILSAYVAALPAYKAAVEKFADKWTEAANIVTNGPFKLTSWDHNVQYTIERNDSFELGPKPKLQKVITKIVADQAGLAPYQNNELDYRSYTGIPAAEIPHIRTDPTLSKELINFSLSGIWYIEPVDNKPPFDNKQVRQAVLHAINRDELVKLINGLGQPAYTSLSPDMPGYVDPQKYPEFKDLAKYDPQAAMAALKGSPYEGGKNWPKLTITMRSEGATANTVAQFIQQQLKNNLNMDVTLQVLEPNVFRTGLYKNQYQMVLIRWYMDYPDPNDLYYLVWYSKFPSGHRHHFSNDQYDTLVTQAAGEIDPEKRLTLYRDAEKTLLTEAAYVPLYYPYGVALAKPWVKGITQNKAGEYVPDWNIFVNMKNYIYITKH